MQGDSQPPSSAIHHGDGWWHLWTSDAGRHYATRAGVLTDEELLAGYEMTLAADSQEALFRRIGEQPDASTEGVVS